MSMRMSMHKSMLHVDAHFKRLSSELERRLDNGAARAMQMEKVIDPDGSV